MLVQAGTQLYTVGLGSAPLTVIDAPACTKNVPDVMPVALPLIVTPVTPAPDTLTS